MLITLHFDGRSTRSQVMFFIMETYANSMASIHLSSPCASSRHLGSLEWVTSIIKAYLSKCSYALRCSSNLLDQWCLDGVSSMQGVVCHPKATSPNLGMVFAMVHLPDLSLLQSTHGGVWYATMLLVFVLHVYPNPLCLWEGSLLLHLM